MNDIRQQPVFPTDGIDAFVAWHNMVGPYGVLCAVVDDIVMRIGDHYAPRAIEHLPAIARAAQRVMTVDPAAHQPHIDYRGGLAGLDITANSDLNGLGGAGVRRALLLPYIRLGDPTFAPDLDWRYYGLPPAITRALKHKVRFHDWLVDNGYAAATPRECACSI
jgi:hypothetical protein